MNSIQVTACHPRIYVTNISYPSSKVYAFPINTGPPSRISLSLRGEPSSGLQRVTFSKPRQPLHVCFAGDKGMMGNNSEDSPWKSLEKTMDRFKGESVEDVLRQQIQKGQYLDDVDSGEQPPSGGGGGGGDSGGPGEPEEESFGEWLDETLQTVFATLGLMFLYSFFLSGEELVRLARDYVKYLFTGKRSVRLKRLMSRWKAFYKYIKETIVIDKYCLEKAIITTPTWWNDPEDSPKALKRYFKSNYLKSNPVE